MIKRDRIFYAACGLSGAGIIVALLGYEASLLFFVAAYLLRPTLHEFGLGRQFADERQLEIHSRSGNLAFVVVMLALVGLVFWRVADGESAGELYTVIGIGLAARAITGLVMAGEYRRAGVVIITAVGVFFSFFVVLVTGFSVASLLALIPGLFIVGLGQLARRYPAAMSIALTIFAAWVIVFFRMLEFNRNSLDTWMLLVIPILTAAVCLFLGRKSEEVGVSARTRGVAFGSLGIGTVIVFSLILVIGSAEEQTHGHTTALAEGEVMEVEGVSCSGGVEYYKNGRLEFCRLAREDTLSGQPLAAGTGVHFTEDGVFDWCFLPEDMEVQGHPCRGGGHDFQTRFYPNGQVATVYLVEDQVIQDVPCARFRFATAVFNSFHGKGGNTSFHDNGRLKYCELAENFTIEGHHFRRGDAVRFDPDGKLISGT